MKKIYQFGLLLVLSFMVVTNSQAQSYLPVQWAKSGLQPNSFNNYSLSPKILSVDEMGNVYHAIVFLDSIVFCGQTFTTNGSGLFISKQDQNGNLLWSKKYKGFYNGAYIKSNPNGQFWVASFPDDTVTMGAGVFDPNVGNRLMITAFDSSGNALWTKSDTSTSTVFSHISIQADVYSNVYVSGIFSTDNFGFGAYDFLSSSGSDIASFVFKLNSEGDIQWGKNLNPNGIAGDGWLNITSMKVSEAGNVYVSGNFYGNISVSPSLNLSSVVYDYFIFKYDANGELQWAKKINSTGDSRHGLMEIDLDENVYITGTFQSAIYLSNTTLLTSNSNQGFVLKFNSNGVLLHHFVAPDVDNLYAFAQLGSPGNYNLLGTAVDLNGNFYVMGSYVNELDLGSATLEDVGSTNNIFICKFNRDLTIDWLNALTENTSSGNVSHPVDIEFDYNGNAYVLFEFNNNTNVKSSFCTDYNFSNGSNVYMDFVIAKIWFNQGYLKYVPTVCVGRNVTFSVSNEVTNDGTTYSWSFPGANNTSSSLASPTVQYSTAGTYTISVSFTNSGSCNKTLSGTLIITDCIDEVECEDCIPSFSPTPDRNYVVSAWVKEIKTGFYLTNYPDAALHIKIASGGPEYTFYPEGEIIDGWQRLEAEFNVPDGYENIEITLLNTSSSGTADVYFDDIRISPYDALMKTFVYNPTNMKLMAELDQQNYATIYEYDEQGELTRVKKETSRGKVTLKENKKSMRKVD